MVVLVFILLLPNKLCGLCNLHARNQKTPKRRSILPSEPLYPARAIVFCLSCRALPCRVDLSLARFSLGRAAFLTVSGTCSVFGHMEGKCGVAW